MCDGVRESGDVRHARVCVCVGGEHHQASELSPGPGLTRLRSGPRWTALWAEMFGSGVMMVGLSREPPSGSGLGSVGITDWVEPV